MFTFKAPSKKKRRKVLLQEEDDANRSQDRDDRDHLNMIVDDNDNNVDSDDHHDDNDHNGQKGQGRLLKEKKRKSKKSKHNQVSITTNKPANNNNNTMSFSLDEDNDNEDHDENNEAYEYDYMKEKKSKKKEKKSMSSGTSGGMGFGGMVPSHLNDDEDDGYIDGTGNYENDNCEGDQGTGTGMGGVGYIKATGSRFKSRGFGSSSLHSTIHDDDGDDDGQRGYFLDHETNSNNETTTKNEKLPSVSSSLYGKEALEKLKAAQKSYAPPPPTSTEENDETKPPSITPPVAATTGPTTAHTSDDTKPKLEQQHIPLPPLPLSTKVKPKPPAPPSSSLDGNEDFIPLNSSSSNMRNNNYGNMNILTGDEALLYTGELDDGDDFRTTLMKQKRVDPESLGAETFRNGCSKDDDASHILLGDVSNNAGDDNDANDDDIDVDEGGRQWEEAIERRAGIGVPNDKTTAASSSSSAPVTNRQDKDIPTKEESKLVLSNLKTTIQHTLENLNQMEQDLESNVGRRCHDQQVSQDDVIQKEMELKEVGEKFEYYQTLRLEIVNWIGALRHVSDRVNLVEKAIFDLYQDIATKNERSWREWEDDVIEVLVEKKLLDYVVGRQPKLGSKKSETSVDEFGRDVGLLESSARTKRIKERSRIRAESKDRRLSGKQMHRCKEAIAFEDSDLDVSDNELVDTEERRRACSDAINIVLNEMDEEYSSVTKLIEIFEIWQTKHKNDYDQCYASLALIDLINVFVKVENCQKLDLLGLIEGKRKDHVSLTEFSWFTAVQRFNLVKDIGADTYRSTTIIKQILAKELGGLILSLLCHDGEGFGSYNPFSMKQTKAMISICTMMFVYLGKEDEDLREKISSAVVQHVNKFCQNLAIPVINDCIGRNSDEEIIIFPTLGQLFRLKRLVLSLIDWFHILSEEGQMELAKFCLMDVVAYRFLPILTVSMTVLKQSLAEEALTLFEDMWRCVKGVGWLEINHLMLSSAPLRSVASKYNIH